MDPLAVSYIYENNLYLKAPQYKTLFQSKTIEIDVIRNIDYKTIDEIRKTFGSLIDYEHLESLSKSLVIEYCLLGNADNNELLGFSTFYWVRQHMLYEEFKDTSITDFIRRNVKGRTLLISGIVALNNNEHLIEIILNETLSLAINRDYNYSLYNNKLLVERNPDVEDQFVLPRFSKNRLCLQ